MSGCTHLAQEQRYQFGNETWMLVEQYLREDWSPEQIGGWLRAAPIYLGSSS